MSGDPEQDYFVDGMVEEIITGLSRIKWLFVIARTSSFAYRGKSPDVRQVGRELGVRYVLEGSVRKASGRVRIAGQLVDAESGRHIWAERYDRPLDDMFALQDEITLNVIGAIEPSLRRAEIERVKRKRPGDLDAYDLVLRAMPFVDTAMPEGALQALPLLEPALALEPHYAIAHGHIAVCHRALFMRAGQREENRRAAIRHAHAALAHGRDDATALALAGFVIGQVEHDRAVAREAFEAALALSPSSALSYTTAASWPGGAERRSAQSNGDRRRCVSARSTLGTMRPGMALQLGISSRAATRMRRMRIARRYSAIPASAFPTRCWQRHS